MLSMETEIAAKRKELLEHCEDTESSVDHAAEYCKYFKLNVLKFYMVLLRNAIHDATLEYLDLWKDALGRIQLEVPLKLALRRELGKSCDTCTQTRLCMCQPPWSFLLRVKQSLQVSMRSAYGLVHSYLGTSIQCRHGAAFATYQYSS